MERSNVDKAYDHVTGIMRNYPHWPSTFSNCTTEGCNQMGRGYGLCADCHEKKLAEYCGEAMAKRFHESISNANKIYHSMIKIIRDETFI